MTYWGVKTTIYNSGQITAQITDIIEKDTKPKDSAKVYPTFEVWTDWFASKQMANWYIERVKRIQQRRK